VPLSWRAWLPRVAAVALMTLAVPAHSANLFRPTRLCPDATRPYLRVIYDEAGLCQAENACAFEWSKYLGTELYLHYVKPRPVDGMRESYPIHVHTLEQMRALQVAKFDPEGKLSGIQKATLAKAIATGRRQMTWVRLDYDGVTFAADPRPSPSFALTTIRGIYSTSMKCWISSRG
jgi:hypothetical protein